MITKDELAAMIEALESQPHLSIKEEKYLAVCKYAVEVTESFEQNEQSKQGLFIDKDKLLTANLRLGKANKDLAVKLAKMIGCKHNWNLLRLVEAGGSYQYCTLCGEKRPAE